MRNYTTKICMINILFQEPKSEGGNWLNYCLVHDLLWEVERVTENFDLRVQLERTGVGRGTSS